MDDSRGRVGVIIPSTNTVVEHDVWQVRPAGVTFHAGRMHIGDPDMSSNTDFEALIGQIRGSIDTALRDVLTCNPTYLMMGMSAETFWGGVDGNAAFEHRITERTGLPVTTGASACRAALETLGVTRIAFLTPYQPVADQEVERFFSEAGFVVLRHIGLKCPTATSIAEVDAQTLRGVVRGLNGPDVDAVVQVGTNLSMLRLADELEQELGKPVLAINAATLWHTLRALDVDDRFDGFGCLLREH